MIEPVSFSFGEFGCSSNEKGIEPVVDTEFARRGNASHSAVGYILATELLRNTEECL